MGIIPNIIFVALLGTALFFAFKNFNKIRRNILLGKREDRTDNPATRLKNMLLVAFGQKIMFDRPIPALLHLFVYLGFLIVNIEMLEITIDGIFGTHRIFAQPLGGFYTFVVNFFEYFGVTVIISCIIFLVRRNVLKLFRFNHNDLNDWPSKDANIILYVEIALMTAFLTMNAADTVLQTKGNEHYFKTGEFFFSGLITPLFSGLETGTLIFVERAAWWVHITGVLIFLNYLPFSKHLHIMLAFPNTYFADLKPKGEINNMPEVTKEVNLMLNLPVAETAVPEEAPGKFGAKDVNDLSWKNLLDAYTCTECGRCTSECPANITGKKLSPRRIMMMTRDRAQEVGDNIDKNGTLTDDGKSLHTYISQEELLACTSCQACVEVCPVNINPLDIIIQMRRYKVMEESNAPASWNGLFSNIETSLAPWKFPPSDRFNWSEKV